MFELLTSRGKIFVKWDYFDLLCIIHQQNYAAFLVTASNSFMHAEELTNIVMLRSLILIDIPCLNSWVCIKFNYLGPLLLLSQTQNINVITGPVKCGIRFFIISQTSKIPSEKKFHPTLYNGSNLLSVVGSKLIYSSKKGHWK